MSGNRGSLERAEIEILNGKHKGEIIECRFNPPEFSTNKSVNYAELQATGSGASIQQFTDGQARQLSVELFFDTSEQQADVRAEYVDMFDILVEVDPELHAPPICRFVWGDGIMFTALVESIDKTFTMFLPSGIPVRARVDVGFVEYKTSEYQQSELSPESTDVTKAWTVTEGDTLWLIADAEYGDPAHWRTIARANDIQNPRALDPGEELELPPL
jgi:nucleoid-associated protein YgaU